MIRTAFPGTPCLCEGDGLVQGHMEMWRMESPQEGQSMSGVGDEGGHSILTTSY